MTQSLVTLQNQQVVTTSMQVAEVFEKQHKDVLEAIDNKIQSAENSAYYKLMFVEGDYKDSRNRVQRMYYMNRDGWTFIAMGFTGKKADEFKLKYIDAFNQMENQIKSHQLKIPQNPMEALELFFVNQKEIDGRVIAVEEDLNEIKQNKLISTEDKNSIDRMVRKRIYSICKMQHLGQEAKSLLFSDLGKSIKELFEVPHRGRIKDKDFQSVVDFIDTWEPSSVTKSKINQLKLDI